MSSSANPAARARDFQSSLDELEFQTVPADTVDDSRPTRRERDRERLRRAARTSSSGAADALAHSSSASAAGQPRQQPQYQPQHHPHGGLDFVRQQLQKQQQQQQKFTSQPDDQLLQPTLLPSLTEPLFPAEEDDDDRSSGTTGTSALDSAQSRADARNSRTIPSFLARLSSVASHTGHSASSRPLRNTDSQDNRNTQTGTDTSTQRGQRSSERRPHERSSSRDVRRAESQNRSRPQRSGSDTQASHNPPASLTYNPSSTSRRSRETNTSNNTERSRRPERSTSRGFGAPFLIDQNLLESQLDKDSKMHQTSSRLLRMTDDDRPFTRDFKDLFSTLMVSLPLTPHRVRFQRVDHTFTSDEAITNLGSLKFSQSNRMPDPKDPSRIVTTTTTTTFSMAKEMARSVCSKFLEARFVESVDGRSDFHSKNAVWQLTPKGMSILQRFCQRNGITARHVMEVLESARNTMHLVILEREADGDKLFRDPATIEVIFRRFVGQDGPNIKSSASASDSDSLSDYQTGLIGVKMAAQRKIGDKTYWNTFTGKGTVDWLMDCCTMVDRRETVELATLFVDYGLMQSVETLHGVKFTPSKSTVYQVTEKGKRVAGWVASPRVPPSTESSNPAKFVAGASRDSNANRMTIIIRDPALRLLFREFLRDTHCEENLAFYIDVREFLNTYNAAKRSSATPRLEVIRETLAAAYSLYNAFLAPGSPCELNIDHSLRTALAARMTRAVGDDEAMIKSLDEVASLFDQAQHSVFKLMASDSVPKFLREAKYAQILRDRNLDVQLGGAMMSTRTIA